MHSLRKQTNSATRRGGAVGAGLLALALMASHVGAQASATPRTDVSAPDAGSSSVAADNTAAPELEGYTFAWGDEFNGDEGTAVDAGLWTQEVGNADNGGWGNQELQYYTDGTANTAMDGDGNLEIRAERSDDASLPCWNGAPCEFTSGRLKTAGNASFKYGTVEARIKVPSGNGTWPAFWSLGEGEGAWPDIGEIDIMEHIGKVPNSVYGTVHGPGYSAVAAVGGNTELSEPVAEEFHTYTIVKKPNEITWLVDGQEFFQVTPDSLPANTEWVFEKDFFVLLNLAVGGLWPGSPDATTPFPGSMKVDYVRVYDEN